MFSQVKMCNSSINFSVFVKNFILFTIVLNLVCSFNLDDKIPLIKRGENKSYFGFSVAQHKEFKGDQVTSWLLVGAPLGQNLQPGSNRSGAFFKCPLTPYKDDCVQVMTDGSTKSEDQIKTGQWLGVSVSSASTDFTGGQAAVCAHRYAEVINDNVVIGKGLCFVFDQDLGVPEQFEPCKGKPHVSGHLQYGLCQAGISTSFYNNSLLIGAPGAYTWTGMVFVLKPTNDIFHETWETKVEQLGSEKEYGYRGMSVVGGNFLNVPSIAIGAPRENNTGSILIAVESNFPSRTLEVKMTLYGEQFGSGFGHEIIRADVNGDKRDDLIVGAPYYFEQNNGGAVYIYLNGEEGVSDTYFKRLLGPRPESRFGIALACLGDLNKDGYEDIAVGAPEDGPGGAVYIFLGSKDGLQESPSQVIHSHTGSLKGIKTFGYSLSGGLDLDNNGYPDLLVGAYDSDAIVLLRTRPIIDLTTELKPLDDINNINPDKRGCSINPSTNYTCFSFQICTTLAQGELQGNTLKYTLIAETFSNEKRFSRVWVESFRKLITNEITHEYDKPCSTYTWLLKEDTRDILSPIKFQLKYTLQNAQPNQHQDINLPSLNQYPILNSSSAVFTFQANFFKHCGDDGICMSDLQTLPKLLLPSNNYILGNDTDIKLHIQVTNEGEPAYEPWLYINHSNTLDFVSSKIRQSGAHVNCKVHSSTMVACLLENPFYSKTIVDILIRFLPQEYVRSADLKHWHFQIFANTTSTQVHYKEPEELYANIKEEAKVSIQGATSNPEQVYFGGIVKGEAAINYFEEVGSYVEHVYAIHNHGPWVSKHLEVEIHWPHQLANDKIKGKWLLYLAEEPTIDDSGETKCYFDSSLVNPLGLKYRNKKINHSSSTNENDKSADRIRRNVNDEIHDLLSTKPMKENLSEENILTIGCDGNKPLAKCLKIRCTIDSLIAHHYVIIKIRSYLWNATLTEEFKKEKKMNIKSHCIVQDNNDVIISNQATTTVIPNLLEASHTLNIWYLIGSVLIGLLILLIVIFCLRQCGFFVRVKKIPPHSAVIQKPEEK